MPAATLIRVCANPTSRASFQIFCKSSSLPSRSSRAYFPNPFQGNSRRSSMLGSVAGSSSPESSEWESDWESWDEEEKEKKKGRRKVKKAKTDGQLVFGDNCHSCRRETTEFRRVMCSRCPLRFCGPCLLRRHGEDVEQESQKNVRWVCPICRGGCGPGCRINCCTCGPCRKYQQLEPAGRIGPAVLRAGFNNVHDYLVHFETGEAPEVIASRKEGCGWTKAFGAIERSVDGTNLTWAMKRMRTARRRLVPVTRLNSKWGIQFSKSCNSGGQEPVLTALIPENTEILKRTRRPSIRLVNSYSS